MSNPETIDLLVIGAGPGGYPVAFHASDMDMNVTLVDPEIAWCGLSESEAQRQGKKVKVTSFPWAASGRAATLSRKDGLTKLICHPENGQILGVGVAGHGAGELLAEGVLAVEMGAVADDLALTIHAHPTLSETLMEAAQAFSGHSTHFKKRSYENTKS